MAQPTAIGSAVANDSTRGRGLAQFVLGRLGTGLGPGEAAAFERIGYETWLTRQLSPPAGDDPATAARLAKAVLPIKYGGGDPEKQQQWVAIDEARPLTTLTQPINELWQLLDNRKYPGQERRRPVLEVISATLIRWTHSAYPLREVMAQFWHDHFNVDAWDQDPVAIALPTYDRDVIRPHCLGNFRAFLEAVATSMAMLYYLSNRSSRAGSANENYARELFELHTLGATAYLNDKYDRWREVPGALEGKPAGYIDQDVYEAARALTGWTVEDGSAIDGQRKLPTSGHFAYVEPWHDGYQKRVLATEFDAFQPAQADGRKVLDLVAFHPATARFICTKLVRRLVSDTPPEVLVERAVSIWTQFQHAPDQIARTVRAIAFAPEFLQSAGLKLRRPLALVTAFARATSIDMAPSEPLINALAGAGQRLFGFPTPNGMPDDAASFLGTSALRQRWGLLLALADNAWGTGPCQPSTAMDPSAMALRAAAAWWLNSFNGDSSAEKIAAIAEAIGGNPDQPVGPPRHPDTERKFAHIAAYAGMAPGFQSC
ncbi:MAG TPA: DUF1800 domain-containing protein [Stellaceae bacterium]|nr:DUF1800 domain-containing protein [Stellaceae bacterium]